MSKTQKPAPYHCETCGADYESTGHEHERGDGMIVWRLDNPHKCSLPQSTFWIETKTEYQWKEGKLHSRQVTFRTYSGHDTTLADIKSDWMPHGHPPPDGAK